MKNYMVKVCIPCAHNKWQAKIEQRHIEAETLNDLVEKSFSVEECRNGARIVEVYEVLNDKYHSGHRIV